MKTLVTTTFVGDSYVGKTDLIYRFCHAKLPLCNEPTIGANYFVKTIDPYGRNLRVCCWDTNGLDAYKSIRILYYPNSQGFMILYSITDKKSFESVKKTWFPEVREFSQAPIILVGCKLGLCLTNPLLRQIKKEEAAEFAA